MASDKIIIDGVEYVRADSVTPAPAADLDGMPYCMVTVTAPATAPATVTATVTMAPAPATAPAN